MEQKYERLVPLFIDATLVNETIIDSILGQLSDGWWENSPKSQGLWINVKSPRFIPNAVPLSTSIKSGTALGMTTARIHTWI